jgi:FkbM family methyltransferase
MTFISYAQNLEDVILWRVLKHIDQGYYIDVGAAWPNEHSITKAFYDHGWKGINVEPNPVFFHQLEESRPRDQNLCLAVSDREGNMVMNFLEGTGLSTLDDAIANEHLKAGWKLDRHEVQVTTLKSLWVQYVPVGQEVHFLKVDVEGLEEAVLRGNDWLNNRPWIVVVESTLPLSTVESFDTWEPILLASNYFFAYADGLNRFYLANERTELLPDFKYPPNVFDDYVLSKVEVAETRATTAEARFQQDEIELDALRHSTSWRITAPLRTFMNFIKKYGKH